MLAWDWRKAGGGEQKLTRMCCPRRRGEAHGVAGQRQEPSFLDDSFICARFAFISGNPETTHQQIQLLLISTFVFTHLAASQEELTFHWLNTQQY